MIKAIIFDCFGVLTTDTWKEFMATLPEELKQPARDCNRAYDAGMISKQEFLNAIHKLTGRKATEIDELIDHERFKNEELLNYIRTLKQTYKISILSNVASEWINDNLLDSEEQKLFDDQVLSYKVGVVKPDPRIYEIACSRLDVTPEQAVMVDDVESNCQAAEGVGMKSIVYHDFPRLKADLEQLLNHT